MSPAWAIVVCCMAMSRAVLRPGPPMFDATVYCTAPLPVPEAPLVIATQGAVETAVHAHVDADATTFTAPGPPPTGY